MVHVYCVDPAAPTLFGCLSPDNKHLFYTGWYSALNGRMSNINPSFSDRLVCALGACSIHGDHVFFVLYFAFWWRVRGGTTCAYLFGYHYPKSVWRLGPPLLDSWLRPCPDPRPPNQRCNACQHELLFVTPLSS